VSYIVKICGLTRAQDALACVQAGVDWLGFIFHPGSPRAIPAGRVAAFETGAARRVGVFVRQSPAEVSAVMREARLDLAQLHGGQNQAFCAEVGAERVVRVFWPRRYLRVTDLEKDLAAFSESAAYFLLDAGLSGGGHGETLDLDFLTDIAFPRPCLLAGGLTAERVAALVSANPPNIGGFDFNSGVEISPGIKDPDLIKAALAAVTKKERPQ
jgi:phosphoribosylanthranilate isomerase